MRDAKKNELKPWLKKCWCIPPEQNAEFVYRMEDVLAVYQRPLDEKRPLVCLDEASKQLLSDLRPALPMEAKTDASSGHCLRQDSEYRRNGTTNLFMVCAPLLGWRHIQVTDRRTCQVTDRRTCLDFAQIIKTLVDEQFAEADKIVLVLDNLNTHTPASLYQAFAPAEAKRLADKLEVHYTPKHGSWLNMAEIEFSVLARQCLCERIESKERLQEQVSVWNKTRNAHGITTDWRFTTADAHLKLKKLYPSILPS